MKMKFVHIADLHLGKTIHQRSLIPQQRELLMSLLDFMHKEDIQNLVIAGDVYDRLIPSQEAVALLDEFLTLSLLTYHIHIYMISGNHDSSERMHFVSSVLSHQGLHIETFVHEKMKYVEKDQVRIYLLPFMKPSQVRMLFPHETITNYQEAFEIYMKYQDIDPQYCNILVTHQFVGHSSVTSESEIPLSVGGSEIIDSSLFDQFDYVALGHLHAPQKVKRETMRYSGSLMPYSFDEVNQKKSIVIVDTKDMSITLHTLPLQQTLKKYQGTFEQFMDRSFILEKQHYFSFALEDKQLIPHAMEQLRVLYPNLLQITYTYMLEQHSSIEHHHIQTIEQKDALQLFCEFYQTVKNIPLTNQQIQMVQEIMEEGEQDENS